MEKGQYYFCRMMLPSLSDPCALIVAFLDCANMNPTVLVEKLKACTRHDYKLPGGAVKRLFLLFGFFCCVYFTLGRDILIFSVEKFWLYLFPYQCLL